MTEQQYKKTEDLVHLESAIHHMEAIDKGTTIIPRQNFAKVMICLNMWLAAHYEDATDNVIPTKP